MKLGVGVTKPTDLLILHQKLSIISIEKKLVWIVCLSEKLISHINPA